MAERCDWYAPAAFAGIAARIVLQKTSPFNVVFVSKHSCIALPLSGQQENG